MEITDPIYGIFSITEPVLLELLHSKTIQRLKGISQGGVPAKYLGHTTCSRYDHSVGVMLLLRQVGASVEEQAAGLLHDASHTAFSHIADVVFGHQDKEDFQDSHHERYLARSDAADILRNHGFDFLRIADCHQFSVLEQDAPALCADRVDYTLQELLVSFGDDPRRVTACAQSIITVDGKLCFNNVHEAAYFSRGYVRAQDEHWGGEENIIRYALFSDVLKAAITRDVLRMDDFWVDDKHCMNKVLSCGHSDLLDRLARLEGKLDYTISDKPSGKHNSFRIAKKLRWIDPMVHFEDDIITKLSTYWPDYEHLLSFQRSRFRPVQYATVKNWPALSR